MDFRGGGLKLKQTRRRSSLRDERWINGKQRCGLVLGSVLNLTIIFFLSIELELFASHCQLSKRGSVFAKVTGTSHCPSCNLGNYWCF